MEFLSNILKAVSSELLDKTAWILIAAILGLLGLLMLAGLYLKRQPESKFDAAIVAKFNQRLQFWFMICVLLAVSLFLGQTPTVILFGLLSFWALREFITMTPTRRGDHRTLFWVFVGFLPAQYILVALDQYALFTVVIPVYASLFIPARIAFTGDRERFLERTAKIQFGLLICVYSLSHAAALLNLDLMMWDTEQNMKVEWTGQPAGLLLFFMIVVQVSDALHFAWDRLLGKHLIAREVDDMKSWEGLIGAALCSALLGMLIWLSFPNITPFTWYGAALMALIISIMASSGSMTMAAIKRDRGVKDYGSLVQGHAGILDRIDSICFAAPIFFHLTRFFLER